MYCCKNVIIFCSTPRRKKRYKFIEIFLVGCSHYHCDPLTSSLKDREIVSQVCTVFGACTKIQSCFAFYQTSIIIVDI